MSVVINTQKGGDVDTSRVSRHAYDSSRFGTDLNSKFTAEQINLARKVIAETKPHIRHVLAGARIKGTFHLDAANAAVEQILSETKDNPGALIGVAKLKDADEGTFLHSLAVSALMMTFARSLGLNDDTVRLLGLGGLIHDLGKMALPVELLRKPGKLTADEFAIIQTHPERGHELIAQIAGMPTSVLDVCLYHHEKFDGSGYPRGLAGEAIPYAARIAAICDVYDALTTIRPYKPAWSQAEAVDAMLRSPHHFDPDLLKAFVSGMIVSGAIL